MLKVRITSNGIYQDYDNDMQSISINFGNDRGVPFSTGVPKMTATFVILKVDNFLENVTSGDIIRVWNNDVIGGLDISFTINERSVLFTKGVCEIYASIITLEKLTTQFGEVSVKDMSWENFQKIFGVNDFYGYENTENLVVYLRNKDDLPLSMTWIKSQRQALSPTPFTTDDNKFKSSGLGIFPDVKPTEENLITPRYKIEPSDIIDYNIESAQEKITHIRPYAFGKVDNKKSIPTTTFSAIYENWFTQDMTQSFTIEETGLSAVYTRSVEKGTQVPNLQHMLWSDGFKTTWSLKKTVPNFYINGLPDGISITNSLFFDDYITPVAGITLSGGDFNTSLVGEWNAFIDYTISGGGTFKKHFRIKRDSSGVKTYILNDVVNNIFNGGDILGIFQNYYVIRQPGTVSNPSYSVISIYSRENTIFPVKCWTLNTDHMVRIDRVGVTNKITTPTGKDYFICNFQNMTTSGHYGIGFEEESGFTLLKASITPSYYTKFVATNKVNYSYGSPASNKNALCTMYYEDSQNPPPNRWVIYTELVAGANDTWSANSVVVIPKSITSSLANLYCHTITDFITSGKMSSTNGAYLLWITSDGLACEYVDTSKSTMRWYDENYHNVGSVYMKFMFDSDVVNPLIITDGKISSHMLWSYSYYDTYLNEESGHLWAEVKENEDVFSGELEREIIDFGSVAEWVGANNYDLYYGRGSVLVVSSRGGGYWESFFQIGKNYFSTRQLIPSAFPVKVADGLQNVLELPFLIDEKVNKEKYEIDKISGRIFLQANSFSVKNNSSGKWISKNTDDLQFPALNSYCYINVDKNSEEYLLAKIINVRYDYTGKTMLSITALIV